MLKSDAEQHLVAAVNALHSKKTFVTAKLKDMVLQGNLGRRNEEATGLENGLRLTARQTTVVQLIAEGKRTKEGAVSLKSSVKTAEAHRANIMRRLNCHAVAELVRFAVYNCIIKV